MNFLLPAAYKPYLLHLKRVNTRLRDSVLFEGLSEQAQTEPETLEVIALLRSYFESIYLYHL